MDYAKMVRVGAGNVLVTRRVSEGFYWRSLAYASGYEPSTLEALRLQRECHLASENWTSE